MPNVTPFVAHTPVDDTRSWVALGVSALVHGVVIAWTLVVTNVSPANIVAAPPPTQRVAIAPETQPYATVQEPEPAAEPPPKPEPPRNEVQPPRDAVPLGPDSERPDALVPREAGPSEPEPEINPPAAAAEPATEQPSPAPEPAPTRSSRRLLGPSAYAFAMSRLRSPTSPFGPPAEMSDPAAAPSTIERTTAAGAMGAVGIGRSPDTREWKPSFPEAAGRCVDIPDLGTNADGTPVLASVIGRVYENDGRTPLAGAHLQIVGTRFTAFTSRTGDYRLEFDPKLLERCKVQYVRVAAEGYDGRMLTLSIGQRVRSDDVLLRRR